MSLERLYVRVCAVLIAIPIGYYLLVISLGLASLIITQSLVFVGVCEKGSSMVGFTTLHCAGGDTAEFYLLLLRLPLYLLLWPGYIGFNQQLNSMNMSLVGIFHFSLIGIGIIGLLALIFMYFVKGLLWLIRRIAGGPIGV